MNQSLKHHYAWVNQKKTISPILLTRKKDLKAKIDKVSDRNAAEFTSQFGCEFTFHPDEKVRDEVFESMLRLQVPSHLKHDYDVQNALDNVNDRLITAKSNEELIQERRYLHEKIIAAEKVYYKTLRQAKMTLYDVKPVGNEIKVKQEVFSLAQLLLNPESSAEALATAITKLTTATVLARIDRKIAFLDLNAGPSTRLYRRMSDAQLLGTNQIGNLTNLAPKYRGDLAKLLKRYKILSSENMYQQLNTMLIQAAKQRHENWDELYQNTEKELDALLQQREKFDRHLEEIMANMSTTSVAIEPEVQIVIEFIQTMFKGAMEDEQFVLKLLSERVTQATIEREKAVEFAEIYLNDLYMSRWSEDNDVQIDALVLDNTLYDSKATISSIYSLTNRLRSSVQRKQAELDEALKLARQLLMTMNGSSQDKEIVSDIKYLKKTMKSVDSKAIMAAYQQLQATQKMINASTKTEKSQLDLLLEEIYQSSVANEPTLQKLIAHIHTCEGFAAMKKTHHDLSETFIDLQTARQGVTAMATMLLKQSNRRVFKKELVVQKAQKQLLSILDDSSTTAEILAAVRNLRGALDQVKLMLQRLAR
ncbi:hypothetical protein [Leuconostoc pseudomesenteroides]|uniref:hypothetical protein n=1 Tax=Leuconostoc pseudomesenteroides TaxID=33968 RepID=UPI0021A3CE31|nr:hypothetical protein [Leuconostoc pseudomesenteroides]MCT4379830.1 hypothetical protein [Leuconostoc pseudomesenteroides]